jgi:hypothetical protein
MILIAIVAVIQLGILIHLGKKQTKRLDALEALLVANSEESSELSRKRAELIAEQELYKQFLQDDKHRGELPPKTRFAEFRKWKEEKIYGQKSTSLPA